MEILESSIKTTPVVNLISLTREDFESAAKKAEKEVMLLIEKGEGRTGQRADPILLMTTMLVSTMTVSNLRKILFSVE